MEEEWRPVKDWEGLYEVSSEGRIRNMDGKILKPITDQNGFCRVKLYRKYHPVHQLVAEAFIGERPGKGFCARHKDGKRQNNRADNLEWSRKNKKIAVRCVEAGTVYASIDEAAEKGGFNYSTIWAAVAGKTETAYGYHWERADEG